MTGMLCIMPCELSIWGVDRLRRENLKFGRARMVWGAGQPDLGKTYHQQGVLHELLFDSAVDRHLRGEGGGMIHLQAPVPDYGKADYYTKQATRLMPHSAVQCAP